MKIIRTLLLSASLLSVLFASNVFASCPCNPDNPGSGNITIAKDCPSCPDDPDCPDCGLIAKDCPSCPDDPDCPDCPNC